MFGCVQGTLQSAINERTTQCGIDDSKETDWCSPKITVRNVCFGAIVSGYCFSAREQCHKCLFFSQGIVSQMLIFKPGNSVIDACFLARE